jgi:hypothetical protein
MDRARQDWVHEYAETGKPPQPSDEEFSRGAPVHFQPYGRHRPQGNPERFATFRSPGTRRIYTDSGGAIQTYAHQRNSGPASRSGSLPQREIVWDPGRALSAIGLQQYSTRQACSERDRPWLVALRGWTPGSKSARLKAAVLASSESSDSISPSGPARLHPSLPRVPTALSCRTER